MKTIRIVAVFLAILTTNAWADAYEDGVMAYRSGNYQEALGIWTSLAKEGHVNAEFQLGVMYEIGDGVNANSELALQWYLLAAKHGNQQAQQFITVLRLGGTSPEIPATRGLLRHA